MGGDGGSIPSRYDLVDMYAKFGKQGRAMIDPSDAELPKWETCAITKELLEPPVVCCELGYLFNKEAIIQRLLDKTLTSQNPQFSHIRSLKDIIDIKFYENPGFNAKDRILGGDTQRVPRFGCPITMLEVNGKHKFSALRTCGCVFADVALREVGSTQCMQCGTPFTLSDAIRLNPSQEERDELRAKLEQKHGAERIERAAKKEKRQRKDGELPSTSSTTTTTTASTAAADQRKRKTEAEEAAIIDAQKKKHRLKSNLPEQATKQAAVVADARKASSAIYASLFSIKK